MTKDEIIQAGNTVAGAIYQACKTQFGVLDSSFLCQSISILNPSNPPLVNVGAKMSEVVKKLQKERLGCVLVVDEDSKVVGIFSERDLCLKVIEVDQWRDKNITEFMTANPVCESADITIAFALNLMSHGGFRHLPIVNDDNQPIGLLSVKDIVDYLVNLMTDDLISFLDA